MSTQILFGLLLVVISGGFLLAIGAKFLMDAETRRHAAWLKQQRRERPWYEKPRIAERARSR
jgi:hypothetical protein